MRSRLGPLPTAGTAGAAVSWTLRPVDAARPTAPPLAGRTPVRVDGPHLSGPVDVEAIGCIGPCRTDPHCVAAQLYVAEVDAEVEVRRVGTSQCCSGRERSGRAVVDR